MKLLAFDTSTAQGSVALLNGAESLAERAWHRSQSHSELLTAEIEAVLTETQVRMGDLDALAVGRGPGSFTGIRVAINAARALAYVLSKPVYVFDTTEILVQPIHRTDQTVLALVTAQKNSFFVSRFIPGKRGHGSTKWVRTLDLQFVTISGLEALLQTPHLCIGNGCDEAEQVLSRESKRNLIRDQSISDNPLASSLGQLVAENFGKSEPFGWNAVQPLYIRASGAEEMLREGSKS